MSGNGNFIPDCDLTAPAGNQECGPLSVSTFGNLNIVNHWDPDLMNGWNKRGSDWEIGSTVQHAVTSRISVTAGYYHRWFKNFFDSAFLGLNQNYGSAWLTPTSILAGRLFKVSAQIDF